MRQVYCARNVKNKVFLFCYVCSQCLRLQKLQFFLNYIYEYLPKYIIKDLQKLLKSSLLLLTYFAPLPPTTVLSQVNIEVNCETNITFPLIINFDIDNIFNTSCRLFRYVFQPLIQFVVISDSQLLNINIYAVNINNIMSRPQPAGRAEFFFLFHILIKIICLIILSLIIFIRCKCFGNQCSIMLLSSVLQVL